jgi:hypothetical protein
MKFLLSAPADDPVMQMFLLLVSLLLLPSFWLLPFKYFQTSLLHPSSCQHHPGHVSPVVAGVHAAVTPDVKDIPAVVGFFTLESTPAVAAFPLVVDFPTVSCISSVAGTLLEFLLMLMSLLMLSPFCCLCSFCSLCPNCF